jgi:hypothetical protein
MGDRDYHLGTRIADLQYTSLKAAADAQALTVAEWVRLAVLGRVSGDDSVSLTQPCRATIPVRPQPAERGELVSVERKQHPSERHHPDPYLSEWHRAECCLNTAFPRIHLITPPRHSFSRPASVLFSAPPNSHRDSPQP